MTPSIPLPAPRLPPQVQQALSEFVQGAKSAFGDKLQAVVLFGSAADGKMQLTSDVNVLLVLSAFEQGRADQLRQPLRLAHATIQLGVMFLLSEEIEAAARSFAPKFADIIRRRHILLGEDPFASVSISREPEIRQLRQQLLNLTLRLRSAYVSRGMREEQLAAFVASVVGSLRSAAAAILELDRRPAAGHPQAFEQLGQELGIPNWQRVIETIETIQAGQFGLQGEIQATFFSILEFSRRAMAKIENFASETR